MVECNGLENRQPKGSRVRIPPSPQMVYFRKPKGFKPQFEAVSCYVKNSGKILLLQRQPNKSQGGKWGPPAGKIEKNETPLQAVQRELSEETGINVSSNKINVIVKAYVIEPDYDFLWYMFGVSVDLSEIFLRKEEHSNYVWATPIKALEYNLALDEDLCIRRVFSI